MTRPRRFDLSSTQVIASVMATLTGAIAASYLGVAGTLVGAAVGSLASTMGTEFYKHYLARSQEKLRQAAMVKAWATSHGQHGATNNRVANNSAASQAAATRQDTAVRYGHYQAATAQNDEATQILPAQRAAAQAARAAPEDASAQDPVTQTSATPVGAAPNGAAPDGGGVRDGDQTQDGRTDDSGGLAAWLGQRRWLAYGGAALGFFVVVVAAITVFEAGVGKPLDAVVWHRKATGTTLGNAVSGHNSGPIKTTPTPSTTPSTHVSASATGTASPSGSASVSPSTSPSTLPSATASTGTAQATPAATPTAGGQLGSTPPATPTP